MIFMPFPRFVGPISDPPPLAITNVASMKLFIQRAVFTKLVGNVRQNPTQNLVAAPSLKASMHSFVVRIALRQHVPLRTCVENPQNRFQHMTSRNRLASSTPIGNMLLRKMLPNALPLFVRQPNHSSFIADRQQSGILR